MTKEERHQKAENFRNEILSVANRNQVLVALSGKSDYSETDRIHIVVLFQKSSYLTGCESAYIRLIEKIRQHGDAELITKTTAFAKRLNMRPYNQNLGCHI